VHDRRQIIPTYRIPAALRAIPRKVGDTGLEPVTPSLSSWGLPSHRLPSFALVPLLQRDRAESVRKCSPALTCIRAHSQYHASTTGRCQPMSARCWRLTLRIRDGLVHLTLELCDPSGDTLEWCEVPTVDPREPHEIALAARVISTATRAHPASFGRRPSRTYATAGSDARRVGGTAADRLPSS
jgi:hypothetical protein